MNENDILKDLVPFFSGAFVVLLGFTINAWWTAYKSRKQIEKQRYLILEEIKTNKHMISQKKDHISKIISTLNSGSILSGQSVNFVTTFYDNYYNEIYPSLTLKERHSFHVIYHYFNAVDRFMNNYDTEIWQYFKLNIPIKLESILAHYAQRMEELIRILDITADLIESHVSGNPKDVFYIELGDNKPISYV